jgi:hypothetical protein
VTISWNPFAITLVTEFSCELRLIQSSRNTKVFFCLHFIGIGWSHILNSNKDLISRRLRLYCMTSPDKPCLLPSASSESNSLTALAKPEKVHLGILMTVYWAYRLLTLPFEFGNVIVASIGCPLAVIVNIGTQRAVKCSLRKGKAWSWMFIMLIKSRHSVRKEQKRTFIHAGTLTHWAQSPQFHHCFPLIILLGLRFCNLLPDNASSLF